MKIFLNPGHCPSSDSGACGFGLTEADLALDIAKLTRDYLKVLDAEVKIFQFDGLEEIVDVANYWDADLFVSIHCNAANGQARGTETFYYDTVDRVLANCIQKQIVSSLGTVDRGIKESNFYVVKHTNCPAVLVETAFIDNADDNYLLDVKRDDFAKAIARGITDFLQ